MNLLPHTIDKAFAERSQLTRENAPKELQEAIDEVLSGLDAGTLRVAEKIQNHWVVRVHERK